MEVICRERWLLIALCILLFPVLFRPLVYGYDPVGYYSWARTIVIDRDLDTTDEYHFYGNEATPGATPAGMNHNPYAIGAPLLWLPAFLVGHLSAVTYSLFVGLPAPTGYEFIYVFATSLTSPLLGLGALLIMYELAKGLYGCQVALLAVLLVWLATPFVFYMFSHPTMAHTADIFANSVLVAAWWVATRRSSARTWFGLGAALGLATLVRTQNAVALVFICCWWFWDAIRTRDRTTVRQSLNHLLSMTAGGLIVFTPQLLVWRIVFGSWVVMNPYAFSNAGAFSLQDFAILRVLFSTDRGLFIWSPVLIFAIPGLVLLYRRSVAMAAFLTFCFIAQVTLVSLWSFPTGASAFGARLLLQNVPTYVLGLAAIIDALVRRYGHWRWLVAAGTLLVVWNFLLIVQFSVGTVPRFGEFPLSQLVIGQFTVIPENFQRIVEAILARR